MNNKKNKKIAGSVPTYLHILFLSLLLVVLTSCVLSPVYTQIENDVTFMYTVFPIVLNYLIIIFETIYLSLLFAVVSYGVYGTNKGTVNKRNCIVYVAATVALKHFLNLAVSSIIDSYIDVAFDIPVTLLLLLADLLCLAIVMIVANYKCKKHFNYARRMQKASKYLNTVEYSESAAIYPFNGFFDIKNPILFPIFIGSLISLSILIIQRLYADIAILGAPETVYEIVEIIIAYIIDILIGLAGYAAAYFASSYIFLRESDSLDSSNEF